MADEIKSTVRNERIKLFATWLNGVGIATFAVGGLAPVFSRLIGETGVSGFILFVAGLCLFTSFVLHLVASAILGALDR